MKELKEQIAKAIEDNWPNLLMLDTMKVAGFILDLIKEAGYVQLAEDQTPPVNLAWHGDSRGFEAYSAGQNSLIQAGWKKVK